MADFAGRVAIVTGAGNGIGRAHALGLAARGARVVVNDLAGPGGVSDAAQTAVEQINQSGGQAIAHGADVSKRDEVEALVGLAHQRWGRVDILVNNAGILRDKSFIKTALADFQKIFDVHVMGRSIAALVGLMNVLSIEGARNDIRVNALCPVAATGMMKGLVPDIAFELITPEAVTPALLFLTREEAPSRVILSAGGGGSRWSALRRHMGSTFPRASGRQKSLLHASRRSLIARVPGSTAHPVVRVTNSCRWPHRRTGSP